VTPAVTYKDEEEHLMKSILAIAVLIITPFSLAFGQANDKSNKQSGKVEQNLMHIEQELLDSIIKGDASVSERYLSDNYISTGPDAAVADKTRVIADLKSGDLKVESSTPGDMKVQVYGNAAVVTYGTTDKVTYKGKDLSGSTGGWTYLSSAMAVGSLSPGKELPFLSSKRSLTAAGE
jgi:hypothetical protein